MLSCSTLFSDFTDDVVADIMANSFMKDNSNDYWSNKFQVHFILQLGKGQG